ncbi:MAG: rhodanese-like domain-containing protein [Phycisphaerales bacterium]|jgi:rhodanese-related sulfurtransferase|nr:rhodanese-like domain-containing protein [Phycisphaerales bacterium]
MTDVSALGVQAVSVEELKQWIDDGDAVLVDVREPDEFGAGHIPSARLLPLGVIESESVPDEFGLKTVLYCRSGNRSGMAAEKLAAERGGEVMHLAGGISAWSGSGLPVTEGRGPGVSIQRQVHMVIGASVLAATILSVLVWPWTLLIAAFFGAGLLLAGLTGTCGLATVLKHMPWNRVKPTTAGRASAGRCCT